MRPLVLFSILAVLLSACGGGQAAQPTSIQVPTTSPTDTPSVQPTLTATPVAPPTDTPAAEPTELPAQTEETPEPTSTSAPTAGGHVHFRDHLAIGDQIALTMQGVAPPAAGFAYEGWLIADDGITEISTGVFEVDANGNIDYTWTSPTGENLIAGYASFIVTLEPVDDGDPSRSNEVVFRGAADPDTLAAARRIFVTNDGEPSTPRDVSYGQGLLTQSEIASSHILNAFNAAAIGAYAEMRIHSEHVINIVEGTNGPRFADYTGDGRAENPGDGFGALPYARQIVVLLPALSDEFSPVEALLVAIQDKAEEILAAPDIASAQSALDEFRALSEQLAGAAPTLYDAAQAAVSYPVQPVP